MKPILFLTFLCLCFMTSFAQTASDTVIARENEVAGDDPSQFFTRVELFNEFQHYPGSVYLNQTTLRTIVTFGKRFTTRLDLPMVYNSSVSPANYSQSGLGDISFRLLGYKILESRRSGLTASLECSLNTAQSPLLGTGKNIILPMLSYTVTFDKTRIFLAFVLQQANSFGGFNSRADISFTKLQTYLITIWSRKVWTFLAPEYFLDYVHGGLSMNLEGRGAFAPTPRVNIWAQAGVGVFGDFIARYQWSAEVGLRYFFLRNTFFKRDKAIKTSSL
jgi:hypothetical protein